MEHKPMITTAKGKPMTSKSVEIVDIVLSVPIPCSSEGGPLGDDGLDRLSEVIFKAILTFCRAEGVTIPAERLPVIEDIFDGPTSRH
jgi:hypothetical protein